MTHPIRVALAVALLGAGAAQAAAPCGTADPALSTAARDLLSGAKDTRVAGWAHYLNDRFYADLACALPPTTTPEDLQALADDPGAMLAMVQAQDLNRNQSDALMMILSAMQSTEAKTKD